MYVTCISGLEPHVVANPRERVPTKPLTSDSFDLTGLLGCISQPPVGSTGSYLWKYEYLNQMILSKYNDNSEADCKLLRDLAIEKMLRTEEVCRDLNENGWRREICDDWFQGVLYHAQRWIAKILKDFDPSILNDFRFSNGASSLRAKKKGDPFYKYGYSSGGQIGHCTEACFPYAKAIIAMTPTWAEYLNGTVPTIITGNVVTTVPKNSKIDRCIAKEPDFNMGFQRCIGSAIRAKLRKVGIDLKDQSINQRLAKLGSISGHLATIDLASASDSISKRLVFELLPVRWYHALDTFRAVTGALPCGKTITWEKFSSMGNGFTFELETLLFAGIAFGVAQQAGMHLQFGVNAAIYGDDIIVPTDIAVNLISALHRVGFETNSDKTFISGPFRESCGKHYYDGVDVSPFFIREAVTTLSDRCRLANRVRQWSYNETTELCDDNLYDAWKEISRSVPRRLLGGCDTNRIDYVVSPHKRGDMLKFSFKHKVIDGPRALLRWFNSVSSEEAALRAHVAMSVFNAQYHLLPHLRNSTREIRSRNALIDYAVNQTSTLSYVRGVKPDRVKHEVYLNIETDRPLVSFATNDEGWRQIPRYSCEI